MMVAEREIGPRRAGGVAAEQRDAEFGLIQSQTGGEGGKPGFVDVPGGGDGHQIVERHGAHGGQVGQVHPQEFAADRRGGIGREEMDTFNDGVGGDDQFAAGGWREYCGVVGQA